MLHVAGDETVEQRPQSLRLPVLQSPAASRKWATQVSQRTQYQPPESPKWTRRLDSVLLHRAWGPIIFLLVVIAVFQVVFTLGQPLSDGLGKLLTDWGAHAANALPDNWLRPLLRDGLWNGVQSVSAYACAVPAIMATRTIENKRERLATILVAPFMTCSARLPVYTLIIAAFIPNRL